LALLDPAWRPDANLLIADEPTTALDVTIQVQMFNLMKTIQREMGITYLFITHDLSVVNRFSDDIAVMYLGRLAEKAPSEALFEKPLHPYTEALPPRSGAAYPKIPIISNYCCP
jgi:ABC-type dipeptide/oligopeptide/nickel transport system ATPase component